MTEKQLLSLKSQLVRHGLKQNALAHKMGCDPARMSQYLNGWAEMPADVKKTIQKEIARAKRNE